MATVFEARTTSETPGPEAHGGIAGTTERAANDDRELGAQGIRAAAQATGAVIDPPKRASEPTAPPLAAAGTTNGDRGYAACMLGIQGRSREALANLVGIQMRNL